MAAIWHDQTGQSISGCPAYRPPCRFLKRGQHFFFSSRRRHTRSLRDWSSDVCSSDLDHPSMDEIRTSDLLADILGDEEPVRRKYSPTGAVDVGQLAEWEKLRDELMYRNRYFPQTDIDLEGLKALLDQLISDPGDIPQQWYRARIQPGDFALPIAEMGAPHKRIASYGRANPAGIPYLYLGSTELTAISEIRPHTGELVCVADFTTADNLALVDLRKPKKMVSPFLLADAEEIGRMRRDIPFLERLGDELTRPIVPFAAVIDYTPSQYICEFIKKCGHEGVIYRSSVSDGINLALFDPSKAQLGTVRQHRISRVSVEIDPPRN